MMYSFALSFIYYYQVLMYSYILHAYIIIIVMICLKKLTSLLSYYLPRYNFTLILKRLYFSAHANEVIVIPLSKFPNASISK